MTWETITIGHRDYGSLTCRIAGKAEGTVTLWCQPLPEAVPFDDVAGKIRYFYTVGSARKAEEQLGEAGLVDPSSNRYADIRQYGCAQWPVSSLRAWLNERFLSGLPEEIRERMVPTRNRLLISRAAAQSQTETMDEEGSIPVPAEGFTVFGQVGNNLRLTFAETEDRVFMPSEAFFTGLGLQFDDRAFPGADGQAEHYWLMDPSRSNGDAFSVCCVTQYPGRSGQGFRAFQNLANANSMNICPSPVFRLREQA